MPCIRPCFIMLPTTIYWSQNTGCGMLVYTTHLKILLLFFLFFCTSVILSFFVSLVFLFPFVFFLSSIFFSSSFIFSFYCSFNSSCLSCLQKSTRAYERGSQVRALCHGLCLTFIVVDVLEIGFAPDIGLLVPQSDYGRSIQHAISRDASWSERW